jgi:SecD/SecF fusion protein
VDFAGGDSLRLSYVERPSQEELTAGKSLRGAVAAGYGKAFSTIFDSNITTLISAVILIWMGTGSVQGFGVTLAIGISVSMFTALVATRIIFDWLIDRGIVKSIPMLCFIRNTRIDFLKYAKPAFVLSWLLVLVGIGYGVYRGHDVLGVDFAGGDSLRLSYVERPSQEELTAAAREVEGAGEPQFNFFDSRNEIEVLIAFGTGDAVLERLQERFPEAGFEYQSVSKRGPSVSAGIQRSAVIATVLAMFGILFYVAMRYEFSFAVAAVVAILHDVMMTMGWFFLSGRELSAPMVAAVLTIIGFSINDTIVIFDRIREDLKLGLRGTFREIINRALNQTLSRTIITSGTTLLATLSLYLFGGGVINDFAFTFLVGIITGTYSTIYIASALVLWWHKGERPKMATQVELAEPAVTARA